MYKFVNHKWWWRGRQLVAALCALLAASSAQGQAESNAIVVSGGRGMLTSWGHEYGVGKIAYERGLSQALSAIVELSYANRDVRDDLLLLTSDSNWGLRRHMRGALGVAVMPLQFSAGSVQNRIGMVASGTVRHVDDQVLHGVFYPTYFGPDGRDLVAEITREFENVGLLVRVIEHDDGQGGLQDGTYLAYIRPCSDTRVGAQVGIRYEAQVRSLLAGVDVSYARYLNQRLLTGSHFADVSLRVGYRF